jgi:hypothetical protein
LESTNEKTNASEDTEALPNNETETETPELCTEPVDGWEKLPRDAVDALEGGELDFFDFGILSYIVGSINWKIGVWKGTLGKLAEGMGWPFEAQALRKRLNRLKDEEWFDFDLRQGQRSAYVIRPGARLKRGQKNLPPRTDLVPTSYQAPPSSYEVSSYDDESLQAVIAEHKRLFAGSEPHTNVSRQDGDRDGDPDRDEVCDVGGNEQEGAAENGVTLSSQKAPVPEDGIPF